MPERRPMGALESEVLVQLWAMRRAASPGEVREALGDDLAYTTVMTILTRLWRKGLLTRERRGRAYVYQPMVSEPELAAQRMQATLTAARDRRAALTHFVDRLPARDVRALRALLDDLGQGT